MQNNNNKILIGLLVVIILILGYMAFLRNDTVDRSSDNLNNPNLEVPAGPFVDLDHYVPPTPLPDTGTKTYTDTTFGFSLTYPSSIIISTDSAGKVTLTNPNATTYLKTTTIEKFTGSVDNGNAHVGPYTISYNNGWKVVIPNESDNNGGTITQTINPIGYTASGLPIFGAKYSHGIGWYAYVVALSHTKFIKISGVEDGTYTTPGVYDLNTDSTYIIVKSVIALQTPLADTSLSPLPTTCVDVAEGTPVITYISAHTGSIGTTLEIRGCNFAGFEGDKIAFIENNQGGAPIHGGAGSTAKKLMITLSSPLCQQDNSFSGNPCTSWLTLNSGVYRIYATAWGKISNKVTFTVQ